MATLPGARSFLAHVLRDENASVEAESSNQVAVLVTAGGDLRRIEAIVEKHRGQVEPIIVVVKPAGPVIPRVGRGRPKKNVS